MFNSRQYKMTRQLFQLRYTNEWIGAIVLFCLLAFIGAIIEAGVVRDWLKPDSRLYIVLPQTGVDNLSVGNDVEVFGIHAGNVRRIIVNPDGGLYAIVNIDPQVTTFVRRDSKATIQRRFAVAGAAYISINRGFGEPLDWHYAVLRAKTEPNPADQLSQMVLQIHERIVPTMDSAKRMMASLEMMAENIQQGKGTVGRLVNNDELIRRAENMVSNLNKIIDSLKPIEANINQIVRHSDQMVVNFRKASGDLSKASPNIVPISKDLKEATQQLPAMMTQLQATTADLQRLLVQVRGLWYLGGNGSKSKQITHRLPAREIEP